MATRTIGTQARALRAVAVVVVLVAVIVLVARAGGGGGGGGKSKGRTTTTAGAARDPGRATGPGTCAFLSSSEVAAAARVPTADLRRTLGPDGKPGCEWTLGDARELVQLEFEVGGGPGATVPATGDEVSGPWARARWVGARHTLYADTGGLVLQVRITQADAASARDAATKVATLAAERA